MNTDRTREVLCKNDAPRVLYMSLFSHADQDKVTPAINSIDLFFKLGNRDWFAARQPIDSIDICVGELFPFDNDVQS